MEQTPPRESVLLDRPSGERHRLEFREGMRDGIPISLGYLAVSFTLGIAAKNAGLTPFQAMLTSLLNNASAGEYAGFTLIAARASLLEVAVMMLVVNARYLLMSCALSQHLHPDTPIWQRFLIGYDVTDELFGISAARPGYLDPFYTMGAMLVSIPGWALGTFLGVLVGNILPVRAVSALSVALYGMFLAVIIPPARKNHVIAGLVTLSFAASFAASHILPDLSAGTRTILLTAVIALFAAVCFPVREEDMT